MTESNNIEYLVAEDVSEMIWLRLRRFTSPNLCRQILESKNADWDNKILEQKADELSSVVRSAIDYWPQNILSLNSAILMRYYSLLQFSIAEQVASINAKDTLSAIQKHTEQGHGLFTLQDERESFPLNYKIGFLKGGHFYAYCKHKKIDIKKHAFDRRPREKIKEMNDEDYGKLYSLQDLLRRVPEFQEVIGEYLNTFPLSFGVGNSDQNYEMERKLKEKLRKETGKFQLSLPKTGKIKTTFVNIFTNGDGVNAELLNSLGLPFHSIVEGPEKEGSRRLFVGQIEHRDTDLWWSSFESYKSGYSSTSVIAPIADTIVDPLILHLMILYSLSIIVRYLPSLWYEIENGEYNHVHAMLEHYISVVDKVLPRLIVERLTNKKLSVSQPGSLFAPV